jgi:hypothetical protein
LTSSLSYMEAIQKRLIETHIAHSGFQTTPRFRHVLPLQAKNPSPAKIPLCGGGPGFVWPPHGLLNISCKYDRFLEYWSNGKTGLFLGFFKQNKWLTQLIEDLAPQSEDQHSSTPSLRILYTGRANYFSPRPKDVASNHSEPLAHVPGITSILSRESGRRPCKCAVPVCSRLAPRCAYTAEKGQRVESIL